MRNLLKHLTGKVGLATAVLLAASVAAQPAPDPAAAGQPDAEVKFRKGGRLSGQEQLTQAGHYLKKMKEIKLQVERLAKKARSDKDIIKLNCVNDKLIQIKGNLNLGEKLHDALKTAIARNDEGARHHEFSKLTITYQKVVVLGQEAEACIGEDIAFVGETQVKVDVDPDITKADPTEEPPPPMPVIRPPVASPFT